MIGNPPVGRIARIILFNKVHTGKIRVLEYLLVPEMIVFPQLRTGERAANHGLEYQAMPDFLDDSIEGEQRIAQMIKNAHKEHEIELAGNGIHVINGALGKFNIQPQNLGGKARLFKVAVAPINAQNAAAPPFFYFTGNDT